MPNPLSRNRKITTVLRGGGVSPIAHNPDLALLAIEVVRTWADVERQRLECFLEMLGASNEVARLAFLSVDGEGPKRAMMDAVASCVFSGDAFRAYGAIVKLTGVVSKVRNKICHWTWYYSPQDLDCVLLGDPAREVKDTEAMLKNECIQVFRKKDFEDAVKANERLARYYFKLLLIAQGRDVPTIEEGLLAEPEISMALSKP